MPAKDKNGIDLQDGDYVKIVVPVRRVGENEITVFVAGADILVQSKNVEAVTYNGGKFPAGFGRPVE